MLNISENGMLYRNEALFCLWYLHATRILIGFGLVIEGICLQSLTSVSEAEFSEISFYTTS